MTRHHDLADGGLLLWEPDFFALEEADRLFELIRTLTPWQQEIGPFGNLFPRLTAYYADEGVEYKYSGVVHEANAWPAYLLEVRRRVEELAENPFNSLLLNYYRGGQDSVGWHADNEPELGINPLVPSVSLGGTRRFVLRHNVTRETQTFHLTHGSLLIMGGTCQHHYKHAVPKTRVAVPEGINLTFRNILP